MAQQFYVNKESGLVIQQESEGYISYGKGALPTMVMLTRINPQASVHASKQTFKDAMAQNKVKQPNESHEDFDGKSLNEAIDTGLVVLIGESVNLAEV